MLALAPFFWCIATKRQTELRAKAPNSLRCLGERLGHRRTIACIAHLKSLAGAEMLKLKPHLYSRLRDWSLAILQENRIHTSSNHPRLRSCNTIQKPFLQNFQQEDRCIWQPAKQIIMTWATPHDSLFCLQFIGAKQQFRYNWTHFGQVVTPKQGSD